MNEPTHSTPADPLRRADALVVAAYLIALGIAAGVVVALPGGAPVTVAAYADVAATFAVFAFSLAFKNSSFYDPYWSVAPLPLGLYFAARAGALGSPRVMLALALVTIWGARLTWNWRRGWTGLGHEDWRYQEIRSKTGRLYWPVSAVGIHLFPTMQVFLGCLPLAYAASNSAALGALDRLATAVTMAGIAIEWIADRQLRHFVLEGRRGETLETGLWAYSRHPNYFGEITFWWGLALYGLAARPEAWWQTGGATAITLMFVFISIPLIDKRMAERRPAYAQRMKRVSALVPWPPRRD